MNNLENSALNVIEEYKMIDKGDTVIVALSGGADSVSLIHFLLSIRKDFSLNIMAAHVNHNLRGEESDKDEAFVRQLCEKYKVELFVRGVDINEIAKKEKISTELCGRNQRYIFFKELSELYSAKIATAHTASDNTETVIFNMTRGCGLKGVTGIQPMRDYVIRPLIFVKRNEVEDYCRDNNLDFVTDSSNLTDDYTRNKIRHNVVPCLEKINPDLHNTFFRRGKMFADLNDYIESQVESAISLAKTENGYNAEIINSLHPALKSYTIYKICKDAGADVEYCHVQLLCESLLGGAVDLPQSKRCIIKQNVLRIVDKDKNNKNAHNLKINFQIENTFSVYNKKYCVKLSDSDNKKELLDVSLLEKNLFFRTRRQGDLFTLPYRNVTKTVKKLMNEIKIPAEKRDELLLLTDGDIIYWIENVGVSKQGLSSKNYGVKITLDT